MRGIAPSLLLIIRGCHRRRVPDRVVFDHVLAALTHGSGYERGSPPSGARIVRSGTVWLTWQAAASARRSSRRLWLPTTG